MRSLLMIGALLMPCAALAKGWNIAPASTLSFSGMQSDEPYRGSFTRFTPVVVFDPAKPETGTIDVTIDMTSVKMEGEDEQEAIIGPDFFATKMHPTARFQSHTIRADGKGGFIAEGSLTIKSIAKPVALSFHLETKADVTHVTGSATILRNDFNVGTGDYASDEWIAYPVKITFDLKATPKP